MKKRVKREKNFPVLKIILLILGFFIFKFYVHAQNLGKIPVIETLKNEQKQIPPDVRNSSLQIPISQTVRVPILMYHYVENVTDLNDTIRMSLNIQPFVFEEQLKTLREAGYTFLTARDLGQIIDNRKKLPQKPILLTFDDGHKDLQTDILPLLKKYNAQATAYIIPGFIGGSDFMTKEQIIDIIESGLVEIGAHTVNHIALSGVFFSTVKDEVLGSKKLLEKMFGIRVVSFAYPNGSFDQQAIDIVKDSGFETAVSTIEGRDVNQGNRFYLYRLRPGNKVGQELISSLEFNP